MKRRSWLATLLLLALLTPTFAAEDAAADLAECRSLVRKKRWAEAVKAYGELFSAHRGSRAVVAAHRDIEDDLKACSFRLSYRPVEPKDFWGATEVRKFSPTSLKVELTFRETTRPTWVRAKRIRVLNIRFRDKITVEVVGPAQVSGKSLAVLLCYDLEKNGGYFLVPGQAERRAAKGVNIATAIVRLDAGKPVELFKKLVPGQAQSFKFVRDSTSIRVYRGKEKVAKAIDRRYKGGYVAISDIRVNEIRISGRLDEGFWRKLAGQHEEAAFAKWLKAEWDPVKVIPAWIRQPAAAPTPTRGTRWALPADATPVDPRAFRRLMDGCMDGDAAAVRDLIAVARKQPPRTAAYIVAVCAMGSGRFAEAETMFDRVIEAEAKFAPALAMRGLVRLILRKIESARGDFVAARAADRALSWAYYGLVQLAIYEGDLERAAKVLAQAKAAGASSTWLDALPDIVHRARRGPLWTRRFDLNTRHFRISSDHSKDLCEQVARHLEAAVESYATYFPGVSMSSRKVRVYVFANRTGYLRYATSVAKNLAWSAGAYDSRLRELVLYLPVNRKHFVHTIRHEGFHAFVHEYLDRAPIWFNEGCAEYFAAASSGYGVGLKFGAPHEDAIQRLRASEARLRPVKELLLMERKEFMADALLNYAQSWAVVHFMLKTKGDRLRLAFRAYFKALREGQSAEEAYRRHLERLTDRIEREYREHYKGLPE